MTTSIRPRTGTELRLTAAEARQVSDLTLRLAEQYLAADDERLLQELPLLTGELPVRVRRFLRAFSSTRQAVSARSTAISWTTSA